MRDRIRQFEFVQYEGTVDEVLKTLPVNMSDKQRALLASTESIIDDMNPRRPLPPGSFDSDLIGSNMFKQILLVKSSTPKVTINKSPVNYTVKGLEDFDVILGINYATNPSKCYYEVIFETKIIAAGYADFGYI